MPAHYLGKMFDCDLCDVWLPLLGFNAVPRCRLFVGQRPPNALLAKVQRDMSVYIVVRVSLQENKILN